MKRKNILIIIIIILFTVIVILYLRRPKISITPDWDKKTFKYKLSVNGCSFEGERSMIDNRPILDQNADEKQCGKYIFQVFKDSAFIWKEGENISLKAVSIDISSKTINESSGYKG